jgi:putative intracellular protease/amidase
MSHLGMIERDCADVMTGCQPDTSIEVALYDGPGASERGIGRLGLIIDRTPDMSLQHLGPADIRPAVLEQFDAIVFPGGSGSKQARAIGPTGRRHVRDFVRQGGGYLGVCAGAYLCSAHYSWSLDLVATHVFTGSREIEGMGKRQMWYRGDATKVNMQLTEEGMKRLPGLPQDVEVTYQNGPIVSPKDDPDLPPYTPLAYFRSEQVRYEPQRGTMIDTPAIVTGTFHRGRVIAISPHPEATDSLHPIITESIRWITDPLPNPTLLNHSEPVLSR